MKKLQLLIALVLFPSLAFAGLSTTANSVADPITSANAAVGQPFTVTVTGVSLIAVANTTLFTVPSGKTALCTGGFAIVTSVTGVSAVTAPVIQIKDSTATTNLTNVSSAAASGPAVNDYFSAVPANASKNKTAPAGDVVVFSVNTANASTTCVATVVATFVYL